ncbi:MAG: hypothetical protein AAB394_03635 [Patescibacteria group bacterium]
MARKDVAAIVSGAGWTADFMGQLINGLLAKGHAPEEIHSLVTAKQRPAMDKIVEEVSSFLRELGNIFSLTLNYYLPLAEAIAIGKYDGVNSDITEEHFPKTRTGTTELEEAQLVHFNRPIDSDDALKELDKMGLRPGELPELLAFGAKYPEKQKEFPIIALGSVWRRRGLRDVPVLWSDSGGRNLLLLWYDSWWFDSYRFLAFRK